MDLVAYSDSEGSDDEKAPPKRVQPDPNPPSKSTFAVNKANPRKIQVRLQDTNGSDLEEPATKKRRVGAGTFSGFNAMLPAPKRDADAKIPPKPAARKVFSLKTGAEPGFSREADAELRNLFAEDQEGGKETVEAVSTEASVVETPRPEPPIKGNAFMFKPLSVARGKKQKKPALTFSKHAPATVSEKSTASSASDTVPGPTSLPAPKKISLFSIGNSSESKDTSAAEPLEEELIAEETNDVDVDDHPAEAPSALLSSATGAQSLHSIASDLNLSEADRRQLFGRRKGQTSGSAINVVNFNTDQEYAANEVLRASGEQIQHNPVRAIAPGKHSLKQLVSAATGQKDALEESFATGRKNKKEAGSKYGW
ncbi:uncharacterized protein A1O9_04741 [Exophiala aquamarina CBS 119918]|uniref:Mitotic checkpoint regulator, MAD2B-interacting-domain-containing protein n=1 Tax=Exophiala aquamarina CBS 119918 TaxID=1182545 RepID=A0A072PKN3_9EURO|nr:uncharacterized protein A1O9_04741 [Exophiala aquamarina CBS 119918]KEF59893.1 hypothetical protein A1O9_04741 [Exophiala aquamarina CBS 119918]